RPAIKNSQQTSTISSKRIGITNKRTNPSSTQGTLPNCCTTSSFIKYKPGLKTTETNDVKSLTIKIDDRYFHIRGPDKKSGEEDLEVRDEEVDVSKMYTWIMKRMKWLVVGGPFC